MATKGRWWGKPAILFVVFAVVVALSGLAYAHWTSTSYIEGSVNTGNIWVGWGDAGTDDDGVDNTSIPGDDGNGFYAGPPWNERPGSNDPANGHADEPPTAAYDRYDKDVGECYAGGGEDMLFWDMHNVYPSYYCHVEAYALNHGSVPVMAAGLTVSAEMGHYEGSNWFYQETGEPAPVSFAEDCEHGWWFDDAENAQCVRNGEHGWFVVIGDAMVHLYEEGIWQSAGSMNVVADATHPGNFFVRTGGQDHLTLHIEEGILCGTQLDPGEQNAIGTMGWLHVEQAATPDTTYRVSMAQDWVNWNEWDDSMCTLGGVILP